MTSQKSDKKKNILVADDNTSICDAVKFMLEEEGYSVQTTEDGAEVKNMKETLPDLILLDIWMSGEDGREICKILKNRDYTRHIPIIMVSASRDIESSAKESGANDFLAKPFKMNDLLGKIAKYI